MRYFLNPEDIMVNAENPNIIISYITMRRLIGIMGILLPFICIAGGWAFSGTAVQESISVYYYSNMRDFFVGLMAGVSMFLITYKGYEIIDNLVTSLSGLAGLGLCIFPCIITGYPIQPIGIFQINSDTSNIIHIVSAALFFTLLAINSFFLFTRSNCLPDDYTLNKKIRNKIYRGCGILIFASLIILMLLTLMFGQTWVEQNKIPLMLEIVMLSAFGVSWLVKGETLFKD
jgi:hypothetical protein